MTHQPRESTTSKILAPLIVLVLGAILVGGSAPWWWELIFPGPTSTSSPSRTITPTTGPTGAASGAVETPSPDPTSIAADGCVLTISNPFATIREEPSHASTEVGDVPTGDYATSDTKEVNWGGKDERWFEITADGRVGWIVYNTIMVEAKSADCP